MAAYLNRTISMVAGSGHNGNSPNNRVESAMAGGDHRPLRPESSPLQIFVKAKKKINDIFGEIEVFVQETCDYMDGKETLLTVPVIILHNYYKWNNDICFFLLIRQLVCKAF